LALNLALALQWWLADMGEDFQAHTERRAKLRTMEPGTSFEIQPTETAAWREAIEQEEAACSSAWRTEAVKDPVNVPFTWAIFVHRLRF
jgi:hypothetical protein